MTPSQISRFPRLAELRSYFRNLENQTNLQAQISHTQELLALLPDVDDVVNQELLTLQQCKETVDASFARLLSVKESVNQEFDQILAHVSSQAWYEEHLKVAKQQRENWLCTPTQIQHLLLAWTKIDHTWKYPVALINAQHDEVINNLLSCYLLYLVDIDRDILIKQFNKLENSVQPRVKLHHAEKYDWDNLDWEKRIGFNEFHNSWGVPTKQMALVVVWNLFERFNLWSAENFLAKTKELLRPGGQIFFNMFNAESANAASFVATGAVGALTKSQVEQLCTKLGFVIEFWIPHGSDSVSVLLRLPEPLKSDKTKWPLGIIKKS